MSDRCVFVPATPDPEGYEWADVVVPQGASAEDIHTRARRFASMPGPHRVFVEGRDDPRYVEFRRYLDSGECDWILPEGNDGYWLIEADEWRRLKAR